MTTTVERYPRGYISMGVGDLVSAANIKVSTKNDAKTVPTLRDKKGGICLGNEETTVNFSSVVGEFGEEADWFKAVKEGTIKQIRVKIPGRTITVNGAFTQIDVDIPNDGPITEELSFLGGMD